MPKFCKAHTTLWMKQYSARFLKHEDGAVLVEFALILPVMLTMMMGMLYWGYTFKVSSHMYDVAQQGARQLAVSSQTSDQVVINLTNALSSWPQSFTITAEDIDVTGTEDVRVTIETTNALDGFVPNITNLTTLRAEVIMLKE